MASNLEILYITCRLYSSLRPVLLLPLGGTVVCHPPVVHVLYRIWPCLCSFVRVAVVLGFTISFVLRHVRWTEIGSFMHRDIRVFTGVLT